MNARTKKKMLGGGVTHRRVAAKKRPVGRAGVIVAAVLVLAMGICSPLMAKADPLTSFFSDPVGTIASVLGMGERNEVELLATDGVSGRTSDDDTRNTYGESLGDAHSTRYAGRVWVDKSVSTDDVTFSGGDIDDENVEIGNSDFLVTFSTLATSQQITKLPKVPVDVVFILDFSASMTWGINTTTVSNKEGTDSRIMAMVDSLNQTIASLAEDNPQNRIAIVTFNRVAHEMLPLTELSERNLQSVEDGQYLSLESFTGTEGEDDGRASVACNINGGKSLQTDSKTNIYYGISEGMSILAEAQETTFTYDEKEYTRIPNVVLMSDGAPTTISGPDSEELGNNWWGDLDYNDGESIGWGDNYQAWTANGIMPMLTAQYRKAQIDDNYGTKSVENPEQAKTSMYTIGFGIDHQNKNMVAMANLVLNPVNEEGGWNILGDVDDYPGNASIVEGGSPAANDREGFEAVNDVAEAWNQYINNNYPRVNYVMDINDRADNNPPSFKILHPSGSAAVYDVDTNLPTYVDEYFSASNADDLNSAFQQITNAITESAQVPTEVTGSNPLQDGYITYTDPIGDYMHVDDMKALIFAGERFDSASSSTSGNVTTYTFSGTVNSPVYGNHNVSSIEIEVTTDGTGSAATQTLTVRIPAALIPVRVTEVEVKTNGMVESNKVTGGQYPLRILYGVSLNDGVVSDDGAVDAQVVTEDYIKSNTANDGSVIFYSNKYSAEAESGKTVGDATVSFEPADTNPFYFVQDDTPLYVLKSGETVASENTTERATGNLDESTTYYFPITYYDNSGMQTAWVARPGSQLSGYTAEGNGQLVIKAGAPRLGNLTDVAVDKGIDANATGTAQSRLYPTFVANSGSADPHEGHFEVHLGNNGCLSVPYMKKDVALAGDPTTSVNGQLVGVGSELTYTINWANTTDVEATVIVTDSVPEGTEFVSATNSPTTTPTAGAMTGDIVWTLNDQEPGATGSVSFTVRVTEDAADISDPENTVTNQATIEVGENGPEIKTNTTTNPVPEKTVSVGENSDADGMAVKVGDELTYTITYQNTENQVAKIIVSDVVPEGTDFVKFGDEVSGSKQDDELTWTISDVQPGMSGQVSFTVKVTTDALTSIDNKATVKVGEHDPVVTNEVTNSYAPTLTLDVAKTVTGAGTEGGFSFTATPDNTGGISGLDGDGALHVTVPAGFTDGQTKKADFPELTFTKAGTYVFTVTEDGAAEFNASADRGGWTYDAEPQTVTVVVTNNGDGTLSASFEGGQRVTPEFVNRYEASHVVIGNDEADLQVTKSVKGANAPSEFEFTLQLASGEESGILTWPESGVTVTSESLKGTQGTEIVNFGDFTFTKEGTYTFTARETSQAPSSDWTYDNAPRIIIVEVTDEGGRLVAEVTGNNPTITNTYDDPDTPVIPDPTPDDPDPSDPSDPTDTTVDVTKTLTGRDIVAGEFSFTISTAEDYGSAVEPTSITGTVDASGKVTFDGGFVFNEEGDYNFTVSEVLPADDDPETPGVQCNGVTYDERSFSLTAHVTEQDGKLVVSWDEANVTFENTYEPSETAQIVFGATKVLQGRDLAAGEFTFELVDAEGNVVATATNAADGSVVFSDPVEFTEAGTYTYTIREVAGTAENVTYDTATHTATVTVADNGDGTLTATVSYDGTGKLPVFTNVYQVPGEPDKPGEPEGPSVPDTGDHTSVALPVDLALAGAALVAGAYVLRVRRSR